ncbi:MAG: hypothetical protein LC768_17155 [Acidobacteria bacterium]|nr:hypothetical protein [Acidobacteriota bacterium]MCA1640022.1 hypothetical protein [Acidobacteriota bacterium]
MPAKSISTAKLSGVQLKFDSHVVLRQVRDRSPVIAVQTEATADDSSGKEVVSALNGQLS